MRLLPGSCPVPARFLPSGRFLPGSCPVPARFLPGSCPTAGQEPPRSGGSCAGAGQQPPHHSWVLHHPCADASYSHESAGFLNWANVCPAAPAQGGSTMPQQPRLCDYGTNTTLVATGFLGCIRVTLQQQPVLAAVTALSFILLAALAIEKRDKISDLIIFILSLYLISYL